MAGDDEGTLIWTDYEDASAEYVVKVDTVSYWPSDYVLGFSYWLAALGAPRIKGVGDATDALIDKLEGKAAFYGNSAKSNALNEQKPDREPDPPLLRARE
jgi:hypothetical protein